MIKWDMLKPATGFYIWASLGVFFALACLVECEICPLEGNIRSSGIRFQNTFLSYLGLDHGHECDSKFRDAENVCCRSELFSFRSTLYDPHSKEQCGKIPSGTGFPEQSSKQDSNVGWLSNEFMFDFLDGLTLACFLDVRWPDHEIFTPIVNNTAQIVLFHGRGQLLYKRDAGFTLQDIEIEKSSSSELTSPCLSISPKKLDWGENYIYHPSLAFLKLENICNENVIKIYEPFTTDSQFFYPFNYSEVVLGPGEVSTMTFVFLPKLLGLSSAELILETSLGGFLVQAKGSVIESPYSRVPLVGLDVSSLGGLLSLNLSPITPFDEAIHFGGVNVLVDDTPSNVNVNYNSFVEMPHARMSCRIQILANESNSPSLEVPCQDIFGICPRTQPELLAHLLGVADRSYRPGSLSSTASTSVLTKITGRTEVDEVMLQKGRDQSTRSGLYVLDDHELVFPLVALDRHFSKSFTVKNPSQQPVKVQLILNSGETVDNCKLHNNTDILSPWLTNLNNHVSSSPTKYGFSIVENTVTEAILPPFGTASLGPIFFQPSSRCEWKSSALIRNNLSGVEQLSLRGFGGLLSLVLLEGSDIKQKLHFDMNSPSQNMSFPINTPSIDEISSGCRTPLLKKLFALNTGDFDVEVERISVSGAKCGLEGFLVHNCKGFALEPGESMELGISYQTDFSGSLVKRDLEIKLASGMLVLPMQASVPIDTLNLCKKSIFWVQVKRCCIAMFLAAVLMFLLFWFIIMLQTGPSDSVDYLIKGDKRSIPVLRPKEKVNGKSVKVTKMGHLKSVQRNNSRQGNVKNGIAVERSDCKTDVSSYATTETSFSPTLISKWNEIESNVKETQPVCLTVRTRKEKRRRPKRRGGSTSGLMSHLEVSSSQSGNSTPSSPLSPITAPSPKNTRSLSRDSSSYRSENAKATTFSKKSVGPIEVSYSQQPFCQDLTGSRPMLLTSATFPGTGRFDLGTPCSYPSRLSISPHARAPGPKTKPQKAVQAEERSNIEARFTYDIWGNHFSGLHLMGRSDGSLGMMSEYIKGHSGSFFVRDPQQTLLTNYAPAPVTVSRSIEED